MFGRKSGKIIILRQKESFALVNLIDLNYVLMTVLLIIVSVCACWGGS